MENILVKRSANLFFIAAVIMLVDNSTKAAESQTETDFIDKLANSGQDIEQQANAPLPNEQNVQSSMSQGDNTDNGITSLPTLSDIQNANQESTQTNVSQLPLDIVSPQGNMEPVAPPQKIQSSSEDEQTHFIAEDGTVLSTEGTTFPKGMSGKWFYVADDNELQSVEKNLEIAEQNAPQHNPSADSQSQQGAQSPQGQSAQQNSIVTPTIPQNVNQGVQEQNPVPNPQIQPDGQNFQRQPLPPQNPSLNRQVQRGSKNFQIRNLKNASDKQHITLKCEIVRNPN